MKYVTITEDRLKTVLADSTIDILVDLPEVDPLTLTLMNLTMMAMQKEIMERIFGENE